jgi:hypothetical protein
MVRYPFDKMKVNKDDKIIIKLKGDGKKYELRIKTIQVIITPTSALSQPLGLARNRNIVERYASVFQGRKLDLPNFLRIILKKLFFNRK